MSKVATCPTCGSTSRVKEEDGAITYQAVQDGEAFNKISQLKKAMDTFKARAGQLEQELEKLRSEQK